MNSLPRLIGYSILLLLGLVGAGLLARGWLQRQTAQIRAELIEEKRQQFAALLEALPVNTGDAGFNTTMPVHAKLLGAKIGVYGDMVPDSADPSETKILEFDYKLPAAGRFTRFGATARVTFPVPPALRQALVNERLLLGLVVVVPAVTALLAGIILLGRSRPGTTPPFAAPARAEMGSLEHLARTSVAQGQELNRERDERRRAEEDALLNQRRLSHSLQEKIRLGRDLHDGIIQSLYAVGLTLESARNLARTDPAEADRRLGQCLDSLNTTIREVRTYISGLAPENLRHAGFTQAMQALVEELRAGREVAFELRIDEDATGLLTEAQSADLLQIAREAISNSLRHGRATAVTLRLHRSDHEVCLLVQDNGAGFDPARRSGGHGLGNMRARAAELGANLRLESRPAEGARLLVTLPILSPT
jgi:signal transduction histidine kinase